RRRGQGLGVRSSLGALGSLWRDKKEEKEEYSPCTTTLKGTRVTSSNGDNYIILSPVNTGEQVSLRRQSLLLSPLQIHHSTPSTFTCTPPSNCGNYQNCTIVQSHLPCSSYGTCTTLAPKTLIFPIFVQPLDLCSPDRTLLMTEEMVLHQANLLPAKVTVLIYSDLLLFTREDEAGRCNVLQSPLYLNTLQLTEGTHPLHIYFLQNSASGCRCLFSLEAFSLEQRIRVSLCLHDNIQLQLVAMEIGHAHQVQHHRK
uniref:Uncharacterized protein n=1 Tax=Mola mola TaxID=94237 RepID=A0A3Q3XG53_MOLML